MHTLGKRLLALRTERQLTQQQMSAAIGVAPGTVSNWELDVQPVPEEYQVSVARILNVPFAHLWGDPNDYSPPLLVARGRTRRHLGGRFELPPYPVKAGLDQLLQLGRGATEAYEAVRKIHSSGVLARLLDTFPRDTVYELMGDMLLLASGATLQSSSMSRLGFPLPCVDGPTTWRCASGCRRDVLVLEHAKIFLVAVPQVWIPLPRSNRCARADLLVLYARGSKRVWADVEFDGGYHEDFQQQLDAERAALLGLPRLGYANRRVTQPGFVDLLLSDLDIALKRANSRARSE